MTYIYSKAHTVHRVSVHNSWLPWQRVSRVTNETVAMVTRESTDWECSSTWPGRWGEFQTCPSGCWWRHWRRSRTWACRGWRRARGSCSSWCLSPGRAPSCWGAGSPRAWPGQLLGVSEEKEMSRLGSKTIRSHMLWPGKQVYRCIQVYTGVYVYTGAYVYM